MQTIKAILILVDMYLVYAFSTGNSSEAHYVALYRIRPTGFPVASHHFNWSLRVAQSLGFGKLFQSYLRDESVTSKQLESTVNAM